MKIVYSDRCLEFGGSPESPERVRKVYELLSDKSYEFVEPEAASEEDIGLVHTEDHIQKIKDEDFFDPDTPAWDNIYEYASLSAGGAIKAQEENALSLLRPPGHHAGSDGTALGAPTLGFCYFNSIAIAVARSGKETLIVDIDGHHGNGTQEIFQGEESVIYLSLHRYPHYPGTGKTSGDNYINYPLDAGTGDEEYLKKLEEGLDRALDMRSYEQVAVSAGFDSYSSDLASLSLSTDCFREIGEKIKVLGKPTFVVLEGGYGDISGRVYEFLQGIETE